ncbi:MAG TPA: diaminopimelate epimerase [Candidatus Amulumruptor caecigallinarius]|uniref:Diaminopimelate epimerase n=1 Tax=Candidatus Amulumruptor caecigallinarius TaxID=2109911 RepID=A0A921E9V1_9BACT|nr:diaminopimelate epimerase [Candidatus Amulumruptor caecigallinarius]
MAVQEVIKFTKMHGLGNDYIYINCLEGAPRDPASLAVEMSDRHKGVGADGIILIMDSNVADFKMRMFNADGSEGKMCGNASRCIGKYVYEHGLTDKQILRLETLSGIKILSLDVKAGKVEAVTVDMGEPVIDSPLVPVISDRPSVINAPVDTSAGEVRINAVSMGNPHGVIFVEDLAKVDVHTLGRELELHPMWPDRANIEFAQVMSNDRIRMRVWERGSGETLACGTGACATVVAAAINGLTSREVSVELLGGTLEIDWGDDGHVYMKGGATTVFTGSYPRTT